MGVVEILGFRGEVWELVGRGLGERGEVRELVDRVVTLTMVASSGGGEGEEAVAVAEAAG